MGKYYSEDVVKDTSYRADYIDSINAFLLTEKEMAKPIRQAFITPEKYAKNPEFYREKLVQMLGFPLTERRGKLQLLENTFVARDKNVDIYRMQFLMPFGVKFYGMYFKQIKNTKDTPFIFGFHGGDGTPELVSSIHYDSSNYNHLVRRMTDRGATVFVPQFLLWKTDNYGNDYRRDHIDGKLRQLGGSVTALELYFLQCLLDYFEENEPVNMDKFGVAGLSYGGMYTLHFTAIDTRVKAAYACSWVCDGFAWSQGDWSYLNAQKTFTVAETVAMIAPRPFVAAMGDKDAMFSHLLTTAEMQNAKPYYEIFGKAENLKCVVFDGVHEVDNGEEELDFLFNHLL